MSQTRDVRDSERCQGRNAGFASALLDPDIEIPDGVVGRNGEVSQKRYAVYRNNVVVSLMEALAQTFPSLQTIMGEEVFRRICRNFVASHPPSSAMMQFYGREFAGFLDGFPPLKRSPFLGDVARLEFAWLEAYHASDAPCISPESIGAVAPDKVMELVFRRHDAVHLLQSVYPIGDLFAWRHGRPEAGADLSLSQTVMVTRPGHEVLLLILDEGQAVFFKSLLDGANLGVSAGVAMETDTDFNLSGALATALSAGLFSSFQEQII